MGFNIAKRFDPWMVALVGGMALVISVNIGMMLTAIQSSKGEIESHPYEKGMQFNQVLEAREYARAAGWQVAAQFVQGREGHADLQINVSDALGPVSGKLLLADLKRPSGNEFDRTCIPAEQEPGIYRCQLEHLPQGLYLLSLEIDKKGRVDLSITLN